MIKNGMPDFSLPEAFEFITLLNKLRDRCEAFRCATRPLTKGEISRLKASGNTAEDWTTIFVAEEFSAEAVTGSRFFGTCRLGRFDGTTVSCRDAIQLPSGIHDSIIINSIIGSNCCLWNARSVCNYFIDEKTVLYNTGSIVCSTDSAFGNGTTITLGMETGGREVPAYGDLTLSAAAAIADAPHRSEAFRLSIEPYLKLCSTAFGIIGSGAHICNCPSITDSFIGEAVRCDNVTGIQNSTIAGSSDEPTVIRDGALIRDSIVQWGCRIDSMAIVERSVCTEHSHVERHAKVTDSIIGPNTGIAEGEVTASLVGPFVGFHHQSLLIGALWPEGKGNVAYGANVGSNHTAKAPDQEIYCGEGLFFGLGVSIKFPADFSQAPYSIIATGVTTLPQKMSFPFSLINSPSERYDGVPLSSNELFPGWVLSDNLYMVYRNETKFTERNMAHRMEITAEITRPEIIDLLVDARERLRGAVTGKNIYTEKELHGIGKNFITRSNLEKAVATYSRRIEFYCLNGLFRRLLAQGGTPGLELLLSTPDDDTPRWRHERMLFINEGFGNRSLEENFDRLKELVNLDVKDVLQSKGKDDLRGIKIMDDYTTVHGSAADDPLVKQVTEICRMKLKKIAEVQSRLFL
ncbi:MAG: DUF4954 family protein [Chitinispirillaceae bacterium]|nr:DUF4954 family protein [Chitinispirillaceae bacterium]